MEKNQGKTLLTLHFIVLLWCSIIHLGRSDQIGDSSWYNTQILNTVVPPYRDAYTTLNDKIVQPLLAVDINSDETSISTLVDSLVCASRKVQQKLDVAAKASEQIGKSIDEQITQLVLSISNQEHQVRESQEAVNQANINIQHTQQQLQLAETTLRDKQNALNTAEHDMREAQREVDQARLCRGRRRKRGFGKWWRKKVEKPFVNIIRQTVVKPICSVVNSGGIDNAKERRTLAAHTLHEAQQRLGTYQQNLLHQQTQYENAQRRLNEVNAQLNTLSSQLVQQRAKQTSISLVGKKLRDVEIHLQNVLGSSTVLEDEIKGLIDFQLVIEPLHSIYQEMMTNNVMASFSFQISAVMTAEILKNLELLKDKMPKMPANTILMENPSITCA